MAESIDPKSLRVVDLKEELAKRNLSKTGKKDELVARLTEALEQETAAVVTEETTMIKEDTIQDVAPIASDTTTTLEPQPVDNVNTTPPTSITPSAPVEPVTTTTTAASDSVQVSEDSAVKSLESPKKQIKEDEENKSSGSLKRKVEDDADSQQEKRTKTSETEATVEVKETTSTQKDEAKPAETPSTTDTNTNDQFAICIKGFVRPLITKNLHEFINQHGSIKRFWIDPIKTHCYVIYETLDQAKDAFEKIDGTIYPPGTGKNVSVIRLTSTQATQLMDREQEVAQKHGRVNWEKLLERVLNNENIDEPLTSEGSSPSSNAKRRLGGIEQITRQLQQRGPVSAIMDQQQQQQPAISILDRLSSDAQVSFSASANRPAPATVLPAVGKSLDELFLKTTTNPPLYYLPVDNDTATKRLEAMKTR